MLARLPFKSIKKPIILGINSPHGIHTMIFPSFKMLNNRKTHLEILSNHVKDSTQPVNLLFVHGMCVGAWVWETYFLPYFAKKGYRACAVSLRGHGNSDGKGGIRAFTLGQYTEDVKTAMAQLPGPTVVVGHSFGGAVVQNLLRTGGKPAGAVLMASVPPYGMVPASWRMFFENPQLWMSLSSMMFSGPQAIDLKVVRKGMVSPDFPDAEFVKFISQLEDYPLMASMEIMSWPLLSLWPWHRRIPVMVMGAENDSFVPPTDIAMTAAYYGARSTVIPDMAHAIMLEPRWEQAADALTTWLTEHFPSQIRVLPPVAEQPKN